MCDSEAWVFKLTSELNVKRDVTSETLWISVRPSSRGCGRQLLGATDTPQVASGRLTRAEGQATASFAPFPGPLGAESTPLCLRGLPSRFPCSRPCERSWLCAPRVPSGLQISENQTAETRSAKPGLRPLRRRHPNSERVRNLSSCAPLLGSHDACYHMFRAGHRSTAAVIAQTARRRPDLRRAAGGRALWAPDARG